MMSGVGEHDARVARVAKALREHPRGRPVSFAKRSVSHQVPKRDDRRRTDPSIDLGDLDHVLAVDPVARTCTAEPGVTFEALVAATLPLGLTPIVVPELRTITIGGAVSGCSLESASFRVGGFHDTCLEYEVITARGEVLRCSPTEDPLLFQMMHGSFGTLGVLSKLVFRLAPARRYVHVVYEHHASLAAMQAAIGRRFEAQDVDFMDGILHAPDRHALALGRFVDEAPYTNTYDWTKVYYESTAERTEDWLETADYYFRYDRGVTNVHPKSAILRLLAGRLGASSRVLRLADRVPRLLLPKARPDVTVDLFIPSSRVPDFFRWYDEAIGFYPLWCVPYRRVRDYEWIDPRFFEGLEDRLFLDLAIYGLKQPRGRNLYREIEEALARVNGLKTLISYNYYTPEELWRTWNKPSWLAIKRRTDPENLFRDLYSKTCRAPLGQDDWDDPDVRALAP